jgi:hypothetical protein
MSAGVVSRRVRGAHRAHVALVIAESLVLAGSAGTVTWAATLARLQSGAGAQAISIALLVSAFAGAAWALERLEDPASVARAIDRRQGLRGAVLTAFQAEASSASSDLARLLGSRVASELSSLRFLGTAVRSSAALLALPCLSIAVASLAIDAARDPGRPVPAVDPSARSGFGSGAAGWAEVLEGQAELLAATPGIARELEVESRRISEDAAAMRARILVGGKSSAESENELRSLEHRLALLRQAIRPGTVTAEEPRGRMAGPDSGTDESPDGSMRAETDLPRPTDTADGGREERGVLASRWWASRYDGIVDRWIASRRESPAR